MTLISGLGVERQMISQENVLDVMQPEWNFALMFIFPGLAWTKNDFDQNPVDLSYLFRCAHHKISIRVASIIEHKAFRGLSVYSC